MKAVYFASASTRSLEQLTVNIDSVTHIGNTVQRPGRLIAIVIQHIIKTIFIDSCHLTRY